MWETKTIMPINNQQYLEDKPYVQFLWPESSPSVNNQINETNQRIISNKKEFSLKWKNCKILDGS